MVDAASVLQDAFGPGRTPVIAEAPGRVNIIGEHTDYNGGWALPFAVQMTTQVAIRQSDNRRLRIASDALFTPLTLAWPETPPRPEDRTWADPVAGLIWNLNNRIHDRGGLDIGISSSVPLSGGLSSSAALEVATAVGLRQAFDLPIDDMDLIRRCQCVEMEYVGTNSGVMDQYASLLSQAGCALLLDTRAMKHTHVRATMPGASWVVVDSAVRRRLSRSGYNDRREECHEALTLCQRIPGLSWLASLSDIQVADLGNIQPFLPATLFARLKHVVTENRRVQAMVDALRDENVSRIGTLLTESHTSLRDQYEVSTPEMNFLVETGLQCGALGARIMGGGFGGVTLQLVPDGVVGEYKRMIAEAYAQEFDLAATVWIVTPSAGARELQEEASP